MQSSTYAVKGNAAFAFQRRSFSSSSSSSNLVNRSPTFTGIRIPTGPLYCSGLKAMGAKLARAENGIHSVMTFSPVKSRLVRAQASSGSSSIFVYTYRLCDCLLKFEDIYIYIYFLMYCIVCF